MGSNFNLYNEPVEFQWLVFIFNAFVYGGLWFAALHVFRLALTDKVKMVLSNWTILGISAIAVAVNIYFKIYLEIWGFIILYFGVAWYSWKWIDRKSLRWTNIALALFFLFTLGMYNLFNSIVHSITFSFFSVNDLVEYSFEFKPYFQIYIPGQELSTTKILIDGTWLTQNTQPSHFRIYFFYYLMQAIAITFWLLIFFDVLKKHMFFYDKVVNKLKAYTFFYAPENFKWSDFKVKSIREKFLDGKKEEKKKLKSGELVKAVIPKPNKRNAAQSASVEKPEIKESAHLAETKVTVENSDSSNSQTSIDKEVKNSTLAVVETKIESENDMNKDVLKSQLLKQAAELEAKAQELMALANGIDDVSTPSIETAVLLREKSVVDNLHNKLVANPVFTSIHNIEDLRKFMEWHVFAVWDFMSLVKRLQRDLTCVSLPWLPAKNAKAAHLINSIVLGEETDKTTIKGERASHFELYLQAMEEIKADTTQIRRFISFMERGKDCAEALRLVNAPLAVQEFTNFTINTCLTGKTSEVLGNFFFGRENVIPEMFEALLKDWNIDKEKAPTFVYYLERHIELDKDDHGPAAQAMINSLFPMEEQKLELYRAAQKAVQARIDLWDTLHKEIKKS